MHQRIKYDVLSQKELEYMKGRLEQILIERGVHLDHEEMLKALEEKGCIVDMEARDVRFTKELIDKAIAAVPAEFTLYSPDGKHDLKFPSPDGRFSLDMGRSPGFGSTFTDYMHSSCLLSLRLRTLST